jgi:ABC-type bacteriocin/lantibiotic exporter with double-glycine peptidase domain
MRANRRLMCWLGLLSLLMAALGFAVPVVTAQVVDRIAGRGTGGESLLVPASLILATATLALLRGLAVTRFQDRLGRQLPGAMLARLLAAPYRFAERRGTGGLVAAIGSTSVVRNALSSWFVMAVLDGILALGYLVAVVVGDASLGLLALGIGAAQLLPALWLGARVRRLHTQELLAEGLAASRLTEAVAGVEVLKVAGAESRALAEWTRTHTSALDLTARIGRLAAGVDTLTAISRVVAPVMLLTAAGARAASGNLGPGEAIGLATLAIAALTPLSALASHVRTVQELRAVLDHMADVAQAPAERVHAQPMAAKLTGCIELDGVGFRYDAGAPLALHDISVRIPAGAKVAVVGRSGSGKSTLVKLLIALYEPSEGAVRFDGADLSALDLGSVRRQMGVVPQDPRLFAGSIRDNIALARPQSTFDDVVTAASLAAVHEEIVALPRGYDTVLGESGAGLSGGQRQRIALARALVARPAVLLLDEATSHLDTQTEAAIEDNLRHQPMTRIVVAHRLSTVRDADLILVIDGGRLVECGGHADLVERAGIYAALVRAQNQPVAAYSN